MLQNIVSLSDSAAAAASPGDNTMSVLERLGLGGSVSVLGMVVVFIGLLLLIVITQLYPKIAGALIAWSAAGKEKRAAKKAARAAAAKEAAVSAQTAAAAAGHDELIAVISAAVAASLGVSANGVVIKSIKRTGTNAPAWGVRGRIEQVYNRF